MKPKSRPPFTLAPAAGIRFSSGAVLLEVVLALGLFVAGATVALGGFSTATDTVDRLRRELTAVNLASSLIAEVQLGVRSLRSGRAEPFEPPFEEWSWSFAVEPLSRTELVSLGGDSDRADLGLLRVEAVVSRADYAYRLTQLLVDRSPSGSLESASSPAESNPDVEDER